MLHFLFVKLFFRVRDYCEKREGERAKLIRRQRRSGLRNESYERVRFASAGGVDNLALGAKNKPPGRLMRWRGE